MLNIEAKYKKALKYRGALVKNGAKESSKKFRLVNR